MCKKITGFVQENFIAILLVGIIAVICWLVPLASGDDWTFSSWYKGLNNFPESWVWIYSFFNGRPTIHLLFTLGYYLKIYCVLLPVCILLFFIAGKKVLKIEGIFPQLVMATLLLCFSWNMKRNIYLWVVGGYAYWVTWAVELALFAIVCTKSTEPKETAHQKTKAGWIAVGIFFFNFGTENMAVGVMMLYVSYVFMNIFYHKKINYYVFLALGAAVISSLMCVCNPAGTRYEETMSALDKTIGELVRGNLYSIVDFLILQNYILYIFMGAILLLLYRQFGLKNRIWLIMFSIQYVILIILHFPLQSTMARGLSGIAIGGKLLAALEALRVLLLEDCIASILFWLAFLTALFAGFFFIVHEKSEPEEFQVIRALFISATFSVGVFVVLPEISERVMFYALSILILYCGYLSRYIRLDGIRYKEIVAMLCLVSLVQFDQLYFNAANAYRITRERESIISSYQIMAGLGLANDIHTLFLPAYPENSINWADDNCNPDESTNPYAYNAFKNYYNIPDDVRVIIR